MPTISDIAICLRHWNYSETSQTVSLFTREHGVIRGLAKGAKRPRGAFSGGIEVLTKGEVVAIVKPGRDLATITAWHLVDACRAVRMQLSANRAGLYMADLVAHMVTDHDPHPRLFDQLAASLEALSEAHRNASSLLKLQWSVLLEAGYRPQLDHDAETGRAIPADQDPVAFSPEHGGVVAAIEGARRWAVRRETIELLRELAASGIVDEGRVEVIDRANRLLATYCRELIGHDLPAAAWAFSDVSCGPPSSDVPRKAPQ